MKRSLFSLSALILSFCLALPPSLRADSQVSSIAHDNLYVYGTAQTSPLTLHPIDFQLADANAASLNIDDLGFQKKETEQDPALQKTLNRRTKMLKTHQILGLATGAAMLLTLSSASDSVGERGEGGKSTRARHARLGWRLVRCILRRLPLLSYLLKSKIRNIRAAQKFTESWLVFISLPCWPPCIMESPTNGSWTEEKIRVDTKAQRLQLQPPLSFQHWP